MGKKEKLYERALATCVVMLIACVILKLFGVQWFNLDTGLPLLNAIDRVICDSYILKTAYNLIFYSINSFLLFSIVFKKPVIRFRYVLVFLCIMYLKDNYPTYGTISEQLLLLSLVLMENKELSIKECCFRFLYVTLCILIFQCISLYLRSISYTIGQQGVVISTLYMIDYYIMMFMLYEKERRNIKWISQASGFCQVKKLWKKHSQNSKQCFDKEI